MEPVELWVQDEKFREWGWKTFLAFEKPRPVWISRLWMYILSVV